MRTCNQIAKLRGKRVMDRRPILLLGVSQFVYWGIAYYAFSALLVSMGVEFHASEASVAGAFSLGLGISAVAAVRVGHALDHGAGVRVMRIGSLLGAPLLVAWSFAENLAQVYAVWAVLGAVMASVLYETAFALVTRTVNEPRQRLSALASVTVFGGLSSSFFLPLCGWLVTHGDWRVALRVLAAIWFLMAVLLIRFGLPPFDIPKGTLFDHDKPPPQRIRVWLIAAPFVTAVFASMSVITLVIPTLVDHGVSLEQAAWVLAALGIMQLPGRLWFWRARTFSPALFLIVPLILQASGLAALGVAQTLPIAFGGVALFGLGAGLHTLARPWLVPLVFGVLATGRVNGAIARGQAFARAAGPFASVFAYEHVGPRIVFLTFGFGVIALCPLARWASRQIDVQSPGATSY